MIDKDKIKQLVDKYYSLKEAGKLKDYKEEETKKSFIQPLFSALGWNMEDSEEVSAEEIVKNKRADYAFKIEGIPKFFLEAKSLKEEDIINLNYVEQAIDYAWMKSCTWAILTNFRTLVVYNAEQKSSDPRMNRFLIFIDPKEYLEKINQLMLLSKESIKRGELDERAEEFGKKELKRPIDAVLLDDITYFREILYNNIKKLNQNLNNEDIEESIQRIIDRLIFIRNAEDRAMESEELRSKIREWGNADKSKLLAKLSDLYLKYDNIYNSKLFSRHLCDDLKIDEDIISTVINGLYESKDGLYRYDFSFIPADVLGKIYEQYLGRILKKVGKTSKLEASKAKRKSEGIYYTPTYIVDYIVKNTVGEYIKTHKENDIENVKILDPACGSGSFLLKAYDTLENYWKEKRKLNETKLEESGSYSKKVDIVTKNIFGVDLDEKAVEIAQLNLLLKIAEKRKRLPTLQKNIKNGNSLIDDTKIAGDKAFKWDDEFAEIMKNGGFDIVVGNPPYVSNKEIDIRDKNYYSKNENYKFAVNQYDLYTLFIERAYNILRDGGKFGFIIPDAFLSRSNMSELREFLLKETSIEYIFTLNGVFSDPSVASVIFIYKKEKPTSNHTIIFVKSRDLKDAIEGKLKTINIKQKTFLSLPNHTMIFANDNQINIIQKINNNCKELQHFSLAMFRGEELGKKAGVIVSKSEGSLMVLAGEDINRYSIKLGNKFIKKMDVKKGVEKYLQKKIMIRQLGTKINATLDTNGTFITIQSVYNIITKDSVDPRYILGIINSKVIGFYYILIFGSKQLFPRILLENLNQLPIKEASAKEALKLIGLVEKMLNYNNLIKNSMEKRTDNIIKLEEEIQKTDKEIDELVYKIYGITDEEKKIIEESLK